MNNRALCHSGKAGQPLGVRWLMLPGSPGQARHHMGEEGESVQGAAGRDPGSCPQLHSWQTAGLHLSKVEEIASNLTWRSPGTAMAGAGGGQEDTLFSVHTDLEY